MYLLLPYNSGRRPAYKDAGVMGAAIKTNMKSNPMMTSPGFGAVPNSNMFQPAFQPGKTVLLLL